MNTIGHYLNDAGSLRREALSLLAFICQQDSSWILAHPEYTLTKEEYKLFIAKQLKLKKGWPLAYLLGYKNFYNYSFKVTPAVLIPRPESEKIIEESLAYTRRHSKNKQIFLDLGTGSGALIISMAAELKTKLPSAYKKSYFWASDISDAALKIAEINAKQHKVKAKINFRHGNLLAPWRSDLKNSSKLPIFIAANLPYLTPVQQKQEPSITYEPQLALIGGSDGLQPYRRLLQQIEQMMPETSFCLMMEINPKQAPALIKEAKKYFKKTEIKKTPDLSGRTRFIVIER